MLRMEIPEEPPKSTCYKKWELPSKLSESEEEKELFENLLMYHGNEMWKRTELEWVSLNGDFFDYKRWNDARYEKMVDWIGKGKVLTPIFLKEIEGKNDQLRLMDGNHRSAVLAEKGYSHILANVTRTATDPPMITNEQPDDRKGLTRKAILNNALMQLTSLAGGIINKVYIPPTNNDDQYGLSRRETRDYLIQRRAIKRFSFKFGCENGNNSLEVIDVNDDGQFTVCLKLIGEVPFDLTGEIPELQKDLKELIVSWRPRRVIRGL